MPEDTRIFISYARKDGAELAQRLQTDLKSNGFNPWLDTREIAGGDSWTDDIESGIDAAEAVLVLLTPGSYASRICRAEQLRALRKDKLVIPLLARTVTDIPLHLESSNYRDFTGVVPYETQFRILLEDLGQGRGGAKLKINYRSTRVTAPPLPLTFVPRPEEQHHLRQLVMANTDGASIALTALEGMGGIGKTILAQSLCHDEAIKQAFPDGVLWATAGQEQVHSFRDRINEIRRALNDQPDPTESELACINRYRSLLHDKAVLLVVDDVWRVADIEPFLVESARSCVLFTTRDGSIAASLGARECHADLLAPEKSRELLARYSGVALHELPREAGSLIEQCGRLPLALAMVGAMLRGKSPAFWQRVLTLLRSADLGKIRAQFPNYRHDDLLKCIQVSVNALEPQQRERYLAMAVLLEDMAAAPEVQQVLWNADPGEAMDTAEKFIVLSLAQREREGIRLHDLQLDYVRAHFPDRKALDLIHGAIRLSVHVITSDPGQFASQVVGRLLPHQDLPAITRFTASIVESARVPWLRPLRPALSPPGTALVRTLTGHSRAVTAVAVNEDGRRAVSASQDGTLKTWDLETGRELRAMEIHSGIVNAVVITRNGSRVLAGSSDNTIKMWNLESGRELCTLRGHKGSVVGLAVSADGRRAVSASEDCRLKVWDLESGRELQTLNGHSNHISAVAVTPDGQRAVSASDDKTLKFWDLATGRELRTLIGHWDRIKAVAVTPDARRAVSASFQVLKVWDLESGRELRTLPDPGWINGVAIKADGRQAVSACTDETLKLWDLENGRELRVFKGHSSLVLAVAVSGDWRRAVSASFDKTLKLWNLESTPALCEPSGHSGRVNGVAVSRDGRRAVSASHDKTVKVWDLESRSELRTLQGHRSQVLGVAITADGRRVVSVSYDTTAIVWDLESGSELRRLVGHSAPVNHVAVSTDGRWAVTASNDLILIVWDLESGRAIRTLEGHSHAVIGVALSSDGRLAVSASSEVLKVWNLESGRELRSLFGHSDWVNAVAMSADGHLAVSASSDKTLSLWDLESGRAIRVLTGHSDSVRAVTLSGNGRRVVSASSDNTVKVWDADTGAVLSTFTCDADVRCCAMAMADDRSIIAGDGLGLLHFLSFETDEYSCSV